MNDCTDPLVVVWCITYNQKDFIRNALDGFLIQKTNFPIEVVVHDDASTDGTTEIVLEYAAKYPELFTPMIETENQWEKGGLKRIIAIMNEMHRRGKYVAFCEGDDYWTDENKLQTQVAFLESHRDYSMCFHSAKKKYECKAKAWINCEDIEDRDYNPTEVFINWTVPTASIVCRNRAMEFYEKLKNPQCIQNYDIFIILSCAMTGKLHGMHQQMSVYRIQGDGLTYNQPAMVRTTMNNPDHFMCLKEDFPIVDPKSVDDTISKTFFERAQIQQSVTLQILDYWKSFTYNPVRFFKMSVKLLGKLVRREK